MFDAKKLLDQIMTSKQTGTLPGGLGQIARDALGAATGSAPGGGGASVGGAGGGVGGIAAGTLAGGVVGLLLGNKKARKFVGKTAGTALAVGGLAAVAGLAYTAWQRNREGAAGTPVTAAPGAPMLPPPDSPFATQNAPGGEDALARGVIVAMIQGAKADGHIDAAEQERIFAQIRTLALDAEAKAFVMDELAAPLDMERVVSAATSPAIGAELYAASLLAMTPDAPAERAYLDALAARLALEPGLAAEIEAQVAAALAS